MKRWIGILLCLLLLAAAGCAQADRQNAAETMTEPVEELPQESPSVQETDNAETTEPTAADEPVPEEEPEETAMKLYINDTEIPVTWGDSTAVAELMQETTAGAITVAMSMYGGWEQVGSLGKSYTRDDRQMTAVNGDIVLYSGNQIVVFYGSNSWSYTKLGRMNLTANEVTDLLSGGDVTLTLSR